MMAAQTQKTAAGKTYDEKEMRAQSVQAAIKQNQIYVQGEQYRIGTWIGVPREFHNWHFYTILRNHPPHEELYANLKSWGFKEVPPEWHARRAGDQTPAKYLYLMAAPEAAENRRRAVLRENRAANRAVSKDLGGLEDDLGQLIGHSGAMKVDKKTIVG